MLFSFWRVELWWDYMDRTALNWNRSRVCCTCLFVLFFSCWFVCLHFLRKNRRQRKTHVKPWQIKRCITPCCYCRVLTGRPLWASGLPVDRERREHVPHQGPIEAWSVWDQLISKLGNWDVNVNAPRLAEGSQGAVESSYKTRCSRSARAKNWVGKCEGDLEVHSRNPSSRGPPGRFTPLSWPMKFFLVA